jgi:hypothetical protein
MKTRCLLAVIIALTTACDRRPHTDDSAADRLREEQRLADERHVAELRDLEQRAAQREAGARAAETALDRKRIAEERAAVEEEKQRLLAAQRREDEDRRTREASAIAEETAKRGRLEQTINFFYDALDPHGDWVEVERYGYCWRPNVGRDPRWRPYTDGNWVWTDYGWTWASNEPFGWATYHYGRWSRLKRLGWIWVPGSEWAPAWVAWRRNDNFVGWAPLPPDAYSGSGFTAAVDSYYDIGPSYYAFVPVESFGEPTYVGRVIEPEQNVTIINKTVNVTNVTYRTVQNQTVVYNAGPDINVINERSKQPVRKMSVARITNGKPDGGSERQGNTLRLTAPEIASASKGSAAPGKVKERARADELDHGWAQVDSPSSQKIREQHSQEARKAEEAQRSPRNESLAADAEPDKHGQHAASVEQARKKSQPAIAEKSDTSARAETLPPAAVTAPAVPAAVDEESREKRPPQPDRSRPRGKAVLPRPASGPEPASAERAPTPPANPSPTATPNDASTATPPTTPTPPRVKKAVPGKGREKKEKQDREEPQTN